MIGRVFHEAITPDDVLRNGRLKHSAGQGCAMCDQIVADIARTVHISYPSQDLSSSGKKCRSKA